MPQERCVPHAIAWRGHNPYQALPEYLIQSYPSLNAHTVGYGPFWGNGIPEHIRLNDFFSPTLQVDHGAVTDLQWEWDRRKKRQIKHRDLGKTVLFTDRQE